MVHQWKQKWLYRPLRYPLIVTKFKTMICIVVSWSIPIIFGVLYGVLADLFHEREKNQVCSFSDDVPSWFILLIMVTGMGTLGLAMFFHCKIMKKFYKKKQKIERAQNDLIFDLQKQQFSCYFKILDPSENCVFRK